MTFFASGIFIQKAKAQSEERRNTIQMTITFGGKTIITDLNTVSTSISRYNDEELPDVKSAAQDTGKPNIAPTGQSSSFSLGMEVRRINSELLKVLAKRQNHFDGTITITDTYGKNPTKIIKFRSAGLSNYSDQYSAVTYTADAYANCSLSINCKELSIDGVSIEQ
jgi:hypothetical protein